MLTVILGGSVTYVSHDHVCRLLVIRHKIMTDSLTIKKPDEFEIKLSRVFSIK